MLILNSKINNLEGIQTFQQSYISEKQTLQNEKSIEETTAEIWKLNDDMRDLDVDRRMAKVSVRFNEKGGEAQLEAVMEKRKQGIDKLKTLMSSLADLKKEKTSAPNSQLMLKEKIHEFSKDNLLRTAKSELVKIGKTEAIGMELKSTDSCLEIIEQMLNNHEGVCIGEAHDGTVNSYLTTNFKNLERLQVKTLFLEGVYPELQEDLDAYWKNGSESILEQYILKFRKLIGFTIPEKENQHLEFIRKAREANIRVVGIEPNAVSDCNDGTERSIALHYAASQIINQEKGTGKYLVRLGAAHLTSLYDGAIPGIAELCNLPSIEIYKNEESLKQCQEMFWGRHDTLRTPPNVTLTLEPTEKLQPQSFKVD
jgi:hypothetical protein